MSEIDTFARPDPADPTSVEVVPRLKCWSEDKQRLVQVMQGLIAVNQVGQYQGWDRFLQSVLGVQVTLKQVLPSLRPASIALKTIDKLQFEPENFTVGRYLNCDGQILPRRLSTKSVSCDVSFGHGAPPRDDYNSHVVLGIQRQVQGGTTTGFAMTLRCGFFEKTSSEQIRPVLEKLHDQALWTFEALITDDFRRMMGVAV